MLLFVSPQYGNDKQILQAIKEYIVAVKQDINWSIRMIVLLEQQNDFTYIDDIIEYFHHIYKIKSCLMVGEDIHTPRSGQYMNMIKPCIIPWATIGGESRYETDHGTIISRPYETDIFISLLYPQQTLPYETKKTQLTSTFQRFCQHRNHSLNQSITIFESETMNMHVKSPYQMLNDTYLCHYIEGPTKVDIERSLPLVHSMFFVHGHSNPSGTCLNDVTNDWFTSEHLRTLRTPFFAADGCYVNGCWTVENDTMDTSKTPYISVLLDSECIHSMVLGLLSQQGYAVKGDFFEKNLIDLFEGKTVASSFLYDINPGDIIFIGDPTFHFTV
jgi:hypothetical protein